MNKLEIERVKKDLRELKKTTYTINALTRTKEGFQKRLREINKLLRKKHQRETQAIYEILEKLDIEGYIERARATINKYTSAFESLSPIDQAIVIDYYINGEPAWKIGMDIGFSEDGIRKRLGKIIKEIAKSVS